MKTKLHSSKLFKQVLSLVLALVMVLGLVPATHARAAEGDATLYLKPNANWLQADARFAIYYWNDTGSNWTDMSDTDGDGCYEGTVPAGYSNIIFCRMNPGTADNNWENKWNQTSDLTVPTDGTNCYTVAEGAWDKGSGTWSVYTPAAAPDEGETEEPEASYYVAGSAGLCGSEWSNNDSSNLMTRNADGLYEKTFENVAAGTYEFKITDGTWDNCWPGSNYELTTSAVSNITITFDAEIKEITVDIKEVSGETPDEGETEEPEATYIVAGTEELCGTAWDVANTANTMTRNADGLYEKFYAEVPAGEHKFKITDGSWNNCWGNGDDGDGNTVFTTGEVKNVTILFNAETKEIQVLLSDVGNPYYVAGTEGLCGVGWDPGYAANKMTLQADGLYKKTFHNVPAGTHECKVTDGSWNNSWGDNGNNYTFTTEEAYDVTITFNEETKEITHILSEATIVEPPVVIDPSEYDITIKVHYYRADGDYEPWEVHMWNGVESLSATRDFELEDVVYEGTTYGATATYYADASDTWVGFIIKKPDWTKDPDGDRHIDISDVLSGTVHVYAKAGSALEDFATDKGEATLGAKVTSAVYDTLTGVLTVTTSMPIEGELDGVFTLTDAEDNELSITSITNVEGTSDYVVEYEGEITNEQKFYITYNGAACEVTVPNTYSTETFESEYTYTGDDLGATWTEEGTTFRLWAPTATKVDVNLYTTGGKDEDTLQGSYAMTADENGTWVYTHTGDLNGVYYTYSVTRNGETVEACDPYARTTGVNGDRAMVIDLDSTDPEGWASDDYVTVDNYTDAFIWELHVRDFSIDASSGMTNKGKYLAFTEEGTTVNGEGEIATGVDYMAELGVNYVHLLPVYDINSVDETTGGYNWGYDPKNYNVPEGSYSTDPYNGEVRVNEFKQMVQSLHDNNIGVIMDVVYNHVADADNFCFNQIVPGYFSRIHDDGSYQSNSGCGNDTASERSMVRKYIVDSVLYWAEEYHIDGFRWDLVGLIDYETINAVMEEVHKVNPDIIFYGEGWEMCSWTTKEEGFDPPYTKRMTIQANDQKVNTSAGTFAFFNDTIRNAIHGGVFTATDKGYASGDIDVSNALVDSYMANATWGSSGTCDTPLQTINYGSCHDNYTLFDNLMIDTMDMTGKSAAELTEAVARKNNLAAAYYITAQGVPFIHAGEEMLRSKPDAQQESGYNHNSYASGDAINSIKWSTLADETVDMTHDYYQGLIAFRKAHPALRLTSEAEVMEAIDVIHQEGTTMAFHITAKGEELVTAFNSSTSYTATVTLPEGKWDIYVQGDKAGTEILTSVEGTVEVAPTSAVILAKAEEHTHDYTEKVISDETLVSAADCENAAVYYYSCTCGEIGTETFTDGEPLGHSYEDGICTTCGSEDPDYVPESSEDPEEPETPSVPSTPVKPGWQSWLDKIFGNWWGDEEEPSEPTEPEIPESSEPEESVPSTPVKPSLPNFGGIWNWITGWWK